MNLLSISNETIEELIEKIAEHLIKKIKTELPVKNEPNESDLVTYKEAQAILNISSGTLYNWTKQDKLKSYSLGRRKYYRKSEILEQVISKKTVGRGERHVR